MLNFLIRRSIDRLLEQAYKSNFSKYKAEIKSILENGIGENSEEEMFCEIMRAREEYLNSISEQVSGAVFASEQKTSARYRIAIMSPEVAGIHICDDVDIKYSAGMEYCFLHYAFIGKPGEMKNAIKHNHIFASYVDRAISELEEEGYSL